MRKIVKLLTSKILISGLIFLAQLIFIYFLFNQLVNNEFIGVYIHFLFIGLSVIIVLHINSSTLNPEYKIAWLVPIIAFPVFGTFFYLFYKQNNVSKRKTKRYLEAISKRKSYIGDPIDDLSFKEITYLNRSGWRYYLNTKSHFIASGEEKLNLMIADLKKAEKFILLEYYIVSKGFMFNQIFNVLKEKAQNGVLVYVLYDDFGSADKLPLNFRKNMEKFGIIAVPFNRMSFHINFAMNYRSHRKITVIDNKVAYTGGINIGDEYINKAKKNVHWHDSAIRLEGEAVWALTLTFLENWNFSSKQKLTSLDFKIDHKVKSNEIIAPFADEPIENLQIARSLFLYLINEAKEEILITTPYLILDSEIQTALKLASQSGVKIKIVIPKIPDKKIIYLVTEAYALKLHNVNVEIYKYNPGFIHSKLFVIDNKKAVIGTSNLDFRSLYLNFENNVYLYNSKSVNDITNYINQAISNSKLMTMEDLEKKSLIIKTLQAIFKGFSPLL